MYKDFRVHLFTTTRYVMSGEWLNVSIAPFAAMEPAWYHWSSRRMASCPLSTRCWQRRWEQLPESRAEWTVSRSRVRYLPYSRGWNCTEQVSDVWRLRLRTFTMLKHFWTFWVENIVLDIVFGVNDIFDGLCHYCF